MSPSSITSRRKNSYPLVTPERLAQSRWDIADFARLMGIEPHPGQVRIWKAMLLRDESAYHPRWLTLLVSAGNRAGKTLLVSIAILHHVLFKIGLRPPDPHDRFELDRFTRLAYDWYHFGIQQEVGELVFGAIVALLEGSHEAQRRYGNPVTDSLGRIAKYDRKERGEYRLIELDPVLGGGSIHFRTTAERGVGSLGKEMHGISFDECGFEPNLGFVVHEVLDFRRLSTGGPLWLISTPSEGFNQFADLWKQGDPDDPQKLPDSLSFRMSSRENIGFGLDQSTFDRMVAGYPESLIPQNVDGYFIRGRKAFFDPQAVDASFREDLPDLDTRGPMRRYVQGVDPAAVYDATWSITLDATHPGRYTGVRVERRRGKQKMTDIADLVTLIHKSYTGDGSVCETALDTTGMGGKVFKQMLTGIWPLHSVEFGGTKRHKMRLLTDLKGLIEQGRMRFPRSGLWLEVRRQLMAYILEDRKVEQDAVMALAVGARQLMRQMAGGKVEAPFEFWTARADPENIELAEEIEALEDHEETSLERQRRLTSYRLRVRGLL